MFAVEPVGYVRSSRITLEDDDWGSPRSFIELTAAFDATALTGLTDFSHAEVIYLFDRVPLGNSQLSHATRATTRTGLSRASSPSAPAAVVG
nr:hypothetical protein [Rhodoferax sp.]